MTPRISHLAGDWIDMFHETYCRVDISSRTDLKPVSLRRKGILFRYPTIQQKKVLF